MISDIKEPIGIGIFPEGTRKTCRKLKESQEFSKKRNLPVLKNLLYPRSKGFSLIITNSKHKIDKIADITIAYDPNPLFIRNLILFPDSNGNQYPVVHICIDLFDIAEVKNLNEQALKDWLVQRFCAKDKLLDTFNREKCFDKPFFNFKVSTHRKNYLFWSLVSGCPLLLISKLIFAAWTLLTCTILLET